MEVHCVSERTILELLSTVVAIMMLLKEFFQYITHIILHA